MKKLILVTTLLLALVVGAGQASADPGKGGPTGTVTTSLSGGSAHGGTAFLAAGVSWE